MKLRAGDDRPARGSAASSATPTTPASSSLLDDGSTERLAYADVAQARTVFEWGDAAEAREVQERLEDDRREPVRR